MATTSRIRGAALRRPVHLACALLLAAACGGGGGGAGPSNPPPPAPTHVTPDDGGTGVSLDVAPTITADTVLLDCTSVSAASFTLAVDGGAPVAGAVGCNGHTATFTPGAALAASTRYAVRVSNLKDAGGVVLCQDCAWHFTTRDVVPPGPRTIGGTVTGLSGTGLVLRNNGAGDLTVAASGAFTFAATVDDGGAYAVTVRTQPTGQACDVTQGTGTVAGADVTGVTVTCRARAAAPIAFLYFPNAAPTVHAITPFGVDEVGGLHALPQGAVDTGGTPMIAAHPSGRHLYAAAQDSGVIHYAIGADGALTRQETTTPPTPYATQIVIHPDGQWAYVANCADAACSNSHVDRYAIGADGALAAVADGRVEQGDQLGVVIDPAGLHAYTLGKFTDTDLTVSYRTLLHVINADGSWGTGTDAFYYPSWPGLPVLDAAGAHAYYSAYQLHDRYTVESDGRLTKTGTFDVGGAYGVVTLHPSGQSAYAVRTFDSVLVQYTVGADGALTSQGSFQTLGTVVGGVVVDPSGRFAYASAVPFGYGTRGVLQYDVDAQGKLTPMATTAVATGLGGYQNENLVIVPAP